MGQPARAEFAAVAGPNRLPSAAGSDVGALHDVRSGSVSAEKPDPRICECRAVFKSYASVRSARFAYRPIAARIVRDIDPLARPGNYAVGIPVGRSRPAVGRIP